MPLLFAPRFLQALWGVVKRRRDRNQRSPTKQFDDLISFCRSEHWNCFNWTKRVTRILQKLSSMISSLYNKTWPAKFCTYGGYCSDRGKRVKKRRRYIKKQNGCKVPLEVWDEMEDTERGRNINQLDNDSERMKAHSPEGMLTTKKAGKRR